MYLISEGLADTVIVYLIIKKLAMPFEEWDAFKQGIIDKDGQKLKTPATSAERQSFTAFDRFIWNLKKIMSKFVGKSKMAAYLTAAYMLREGVRGSFNKGLLDEEFKKDLAELTYTKIKELHEAYGDIKLPLNESSQDPEYFIMRYSKLFEKTLGADRIQKLFELEDENV